ncbi:MAG: GFA family protein [Reyranella sp.]
MIAPPIIARCVCGSVEYEASGDPILGVACYCDDCQEGARRIEALPGAPRVRDPDSGVSYILYRKDRIRCVKGGDRLQSHKLKPKTDTNRVVTTCCNSAMALTFDDSKHWVPVNRARLTDPLPVEMRICTKFAPDAAAIPRDVPAYPGFSVRFIWKLLGARLAMALGR